MIQHMHDLCMVRIRLNSVHSPKLLVAKSFTATVIVRARVRAKEMDILSFYRLKKVTDTFVSWPPTSFSATII